MAYNEDSLSRIRQYFDSRSIHYAEKKMFAGVCIMVDDKMCCGTHIDKKSGEDYLLCRIGEDAHESALQRDHCIPMTFTGRSMKGFVFVTEEGVNTSKKLAYWLDLCMSYNPLAKKRKKK
jgi:hypothetical protein